MEIIGIICEYNPFHNGHKYHIDKIKELYPDSLIILCLNGYFTQRGEISILSKEEKVKIALDNNIDLIVELPFIYGCQSADYFSYAALKILNALKITHLIFGSESNDVEKLEKIAVEQLQDNFCLNREKNSNYPTILAKSINQEIEYLPNDLLGISYLKEIKKNNYKIIPISIKRTSSYHDLDSNDKIISASNIRKKMLEGKDISKYVPFKDLNRLSKINEEKYFNLLKYQIITNPKLDCLLDVVEGLDNKLKKEIINASSVDDLVKKVKSKRYTYNRIKRMLIHVLVNLPKDIEDISYIHVLGFNKQGKKYLKEHKKEFLISLVQDKKSFQYRFEMISSSIYDLITSQSTYQFEKKNQPIFKESSQK